ncbi:GNAT family N-acetyltransferase [Bacillus canaveralius]|uniref:GNAT family N-acetyltransferase n=1 Tax=Bacillus canaveralius TaxID=1403243 RepID=A0A2N5GIY5_9BACI|nr:GNAT family N-acetyltransferase [Bacillus canaveralius]PLR81013.1 GNAT family N-acetyltransferase [Bacillus canaveralius]PLR99011.1 GNAT family N-acetyltransferase [Bacillus canaveralius]
MIREIAAKDAEKFLELLMEVDDSGFMLFEPGERTSSVKKEETKISQFLANPHTTIFVAEEDNRLTGYIIGIGNTQKRKQHAAYIVIDIRSGYRGHGIGTMLFEKLFEWAKQRGLKRLELTVIKTNAPAYHLYKKMGFKLEGEKIGSLIIDGEAVNEYYMYKWLD